MLILAMSFSGSMVFLSILLSVFLGKRRLSPTWVYTMLRIDLIFFCLPLPIYNSGYKYMVLNILGIPRRWDKTGIAAKNVIGIEESGRFHLSFQTYIVVIWAVWVCGLLLAVIRNLHKYHEMKVLKENPRMSLSNYLAIFDRAKEEVGIKKNVILLCADNGQTVCTIGVFKKYVIMPEAGMRDEEIYYSLKHELIHVKRSDVAWRYIGLLAALMHWFNPLIYLYLYALSLYCEQSCDDILVQDLDKAERKKYGELIINMSKHDDFENWKYRTSLTGSKKIIEWRLKNMFDNGKKKRIERALSLLLGAIILFAGSLTVCAYENPQVIRDVDASMFDLPQDTKVTWEVVTGEIRYSEEETLDFMEFVGKDGISYNLSELQNSKVERVACIHSYGNGYIKMHHKNSDGSCKTDYYLADLCSKCGDAKNKRYSHTETSTKCIH